MGNIYAANSSKPKSLKPKEETIRFLLEYSKALRVTKFKENVFETILN